MGGAVHPARLRRVYLFAQQYVAELRELARCADGDVVADVREALELAERARDAVVRITRKAEDAE